MNNRMLRADSEIQKELSEIIKTELKDPRLSEVISITWVKTSSDFKHCKAGISIPSDNKQERKETLDILKKSSGFLKRTLAENLNLRAVPELVFELDNGAIHEQNIENILKTLNIPKGEEDESSDIED